MPKVHALSVNYRTHNGVLGLAAAVVDVIEALFPASIDALPREKGFFAGPKPLLLKETALEEAVVMIAGAEASGRAIQFGAHQVYPFTLLSLFLFLFPFLPPYLSQFVAPGHSRAQPRCQVNPKP